MSTFLIIWKDGSKIFFFHINQFWIEHKHRKEKIFKQE